MGELTQFEKHIQTEICKFIKAPVNYRDVVVTTEDKYEENQRVTVYQMKLNSLIVAAPSLSGRITDVLQKYEIEARVTAAQLRVMLELDSHQVGDKTVYLFLDPVDYQGFSPDGSYQVIRINKDHQKEFQEFRGGCLARELNEGVVNLEDPVVYGCFQGDSLVGAGSYWFWGETLADIGIIVHPRYRRQGIGKALVSRLCRWGIENQKINLYRHNENNHKSHQLALSLNFQEQLMVEYISL